MRRIVLGVIASGVALIGWAVFGPASAAGCGDLWYARNAVYKEAGYCFRTARGIRAFGNAGCQFDDVSDVPLSARQRATVADIQREERFQGCSP